MLQRVNAPCLLLRYLIEYGASDSSGVAAAPLTISITFVEVATVTGSFLFIGQADNATEAELHATQLCTTGTAPNSALTADIAAVFQTWLTSNVTTYVEQMTAALGTSTAVVAAVNTLELSLFSSVLTTDVTVLNATIDQNVTSTLTVNSTEATQNYAYNVTLQVAVLTADMLLSVFVDVLNSTTSRRRLMTSSDWTANAMRRSELLLPLLAPTRPDLATVTVDSGSVLAEPFHHAVVSKLASVPVGPQSDQTPLGDQADSRQSCSTRSHAQQPNNCPSQLPAPTFPASIQPLATPSGAVPVSGRGLLHQVLPHASRLSRSLQDTTAASAFPLASLLTFKVDLMLAAFGGTSGCSTTSMAALFYGDADVPDSLDDLCGTDGGTVDLSMNKALLASINSTVPLLQVCCAFDLPIEFV